MNSKAPIVDPPERLIVALDLPDIASARDLVTRLGEEVVFYKIGYQLAFAGGLEFANELKHQGKKVFVDLKLLDIENTVEQGVASLLSLGADMLTVHAYPAVMKAAVSAAAGSSLCLLAVTVLTSMDDADLEDAGYASNAADLVEKRVRQAMDCGMGGVVCSAHEAARVRALIGSGPAIVTPGIRPAGVQSDDQKRIMTPAKAIAAGASHLVVGRPVTAAADPCDAARTILDEIREAAATSK